MMYYKDYPRPQLVRQESSWVNLNGEWEFAFDDDNIGEKEKWYVNFKKSHNIEVPFTYETKLSGIEDEKAHNYVWYHKEFNVKDTDDKKIIHFEGSDYITKVWVNGQCVGSHVGGYNRFSFDITDYAEVGVNHVTVKIEDRLDERIVRGKQRWMPNNFGCFYIQTTGIWKTVWMEYVPQSYVTSIKLTPHLGPYTIETYLETNWDSYKDLTAEITVKFKDTFVNKVTVPVQSNRVSIELSLYNTNVAFRGKMLWSPNSPNLYDMEINLYDGDKVVDTIYSYFGMREIKIDGQMILFNGRPLYQKLILDQGYWKDSQLTPPNSDALIEDIQKIKQLGYNGLRKHQKVEDERFLYYCDTMGMLVWCEMPSPAKYDDYMTENFMSQWIKIVKQNYNHPSIITWTPINESWGLPEIRTDKKQQAFTEALYYMTKSIDAMRPVIVNDGFEHTISDILSLHDYEEFGEKFFKRYSENFDDIVNNKMFHNKTKKAFIDGYEYKGQPIIMSEFGGIAYNSNDAGWGYGNKVNNDEEFLTRFENITKAIMDLPFCCGFCYTQVTDVQQEINGLMDIERNFKISPEKIAEVHSYK